MNASPRKSSYQECCCICEEKQRLELIQGHAHRDIRVLDHLGKLLEADLAVAVQVGLHDGLVDNLRWISTVLERVALVLCAHTHLL